MGEVVSGVVQPVRTEVEEFYAPSVRSQVDPTPVGGFYATQVGK